MNTIIKIIEHLVRLVLINLLELRPWYLRVELLTKRTF